ncbi:PREDICTED: uncharacterized protein LOC106117032 [Papilio xuthus]|uniref:Uncharacterized protein LOC106117032 n=1 Tax=Papilio xuthus TaxID=66420 RepID=A0AAJ6Z718_PAPXU|nr:PREDICTED: uncharacterized protein LOC106117032 [Papilio xuthus]
MGATGKFMVTALLSCAITGIVSTTYIILCCLALIFRFDCSTAQTLVQNSDYFLILIYKQYIQDESCGTFLPIEDLTESKSVFVLTAVSLAVSTASLVAALSLTISVLSRGCWYYLDFGAYVHIGLCLAMLVVDITFAVHFGSDYTTLTDKLNANSVMAPTNYLIDTLRIGSFFLMVLTMKGFMAHIVNLVLLVMLIYYLHSKNAEERQQHSIHSRGLLNAFEQPSYNDPWPVQQGWTSTLGSVGNAHPGYMYNEGPQRSSNWEFVQGNRFPGQDLQPRAGTMPPRPFSYSEDPGLTPSMLRPTPPKPYTPNPDYSPNPRLKSALKSTY